MRTKRFAEFWKGVFFFIASISLGIMMFMFLFVWQPIWTKGFKDFHTISAAISKLDETAKPAVEVAPLMLNQVIKMNESLSHMENTMLSMEEIRTTMDKMHVSMKKLEELNPNIVKMTYTMDNMNWVMSGELGKMNYEVDQIGDKFTPFGMMPFNW